MSQSSAGAIRAGRAFVELFADDTELKKTLAGVEREFLKWGAVLSAAGASIVGPLTAATMGFATSGDELDKLSARTGVSVEALQSLRFAAEQSGVSADSLANGIQKLNRNLAEIAMGGGAGAADALKQLALNSQDLRRLSPEGQFRLIRDRLSEIDDVGHQAAVAAKLFGGSAKDLQPLLQATVEEMEELEHTSQTLTRQMRASEAAAGADLKDAYGLLERQLKSVRDAIGAALVPTLTQAIQATQGVLEQTWRWIDANNELVRSVMAAGGASLAAGTAIVTLTAAARAAHSGFVGLPGPLKALSVAILAFQGGKLLAEALNVGGVRDWNREVDRAIKLARELVAAQSARGREILAEAGGISDPAQRMKFLTEQIQMAEKNLSGLTNNVSSAQQRVEELEPSWVSAWQAGRAVWKSEQQSLHEAQDALEEHKRQLEELNKEFRRAEREAEGLGIAQDAAVIEQFDRLMTEAQNKLRLVREEATELDIALERLESEGFDDKQVEAYRAALEELAQAERDVADAAEAAADAEARRQDAQRITERFDPEERFRRDLEDLQRLEGELRPEILEAAMADARERALDALMGDVQEAVAFTQQEMGRLQAGDVRGMEGLQTVLDALSPGRDPMQDRMVKAIEATEAHTDEMVRRLDAIEDKLRMRPSNLR